MEKVSSKPIIIRFNEWAKNPLETIICANTAVLEAEKNLGAKGEFNWEKVDLNPLIRVMVKPHDV